MLAESVRRHGPGSDLVVFLIDDPEGHTDRRDEPFEVLTLAELPLDPEWFAQMTLYYDVTELATAVKPWVLEALAAGPAASTPPSAVAYLDPDTELFAPLDDLWAIAAEGNVVLTPHVLGPFPRDGLRMGEETLRSAGIFNLGFIALPTSDVGREVLGWWQERLRFDALVAPHQWLFTDQRWMDFAPSLFPCHIVTDPGVNVAYWNLHERPLTVDAGVLTVGTAPLRLMHYSGLDPARPHLLSTHQGTNPRVLLSEHPDLAALCADYLARITPDPDSNDPDAVTTPGYRWATLPNGLVLTTALRERYRNELMASLQDPTGGHRPPPTPLGPRWLSDLMDWWLEPVPSLGLPRLVDALLPYRFDLAGVLEDPDHQRAARVFNHWLATSSVDQEGFTPAVALRLAEGVRAWADELTRAEQPRTQPTTRSANLVGFGGSAGGLATSAAGLGRVIDALDEPHHDLAVRNPWSSADPNGSGGLNPLAMLAPAPDADITVVTLQPDTLHFLGPIGRHRLWGSSYRVAYWWWEVDGMLPAYHRFIEEAAVDEIWVGSTYVAELLRALTDRPVHRVPLPLRSPTPTAGALADHPELADLGIDASATRFTFSFDYASVMARKNPLGLLEAWREAFSPHDGCQLVVKTLNHDRHRSEAEAVRFAVRNRTDVVIIDESLPRPALDTLVGSSAAYVSLHRAEGLGLGMLEATQMGVPVIASASGGCMDFLAPDSSWLVPGTLVPVGPGHDPYPPDAHWFSPDLDVAVRHLRTVAADPAVARATAVLASTRAADTYADDVCCDLVRQRLTDIRKRLGSPVAASGVTP